ncbi:MAG: polyprenyl synthetase family protein [Candidatus Bathyarchaeota archaeon]|nr:polyprenyl synthetase family protein [Candidatus Bathyarchaeota archaeon]
MANAKFEFIESMLKKYRDITSEAMEPFFVIKEPKRYLYDLLPQYPKRGGKGLRPGLCIATCRVFGGSTNSAIRSAASLEFFHNMFLIHDDIEDYSEFRRGKPTLHRRYGTPLAINAGDAMNCLASAPLIENTDILGPQLSSEVFYEISHMVRETVEGQAIELGWMHDNKITLTDKDYLRMTLKKTCWYTYIHPCRIGALIGRGGTENLDVFNKFGYYMGAAFQIQDDVLNLIGEKRKYGKEIGGDIWEGKRTLVLIHLLNHCTSSEREKIRIFLAKPRDKRLRGEVNWIFNLMMRYGSIKHAIVSARHLANEALKEFDIAYKDAVDSEDKRFIKGIVHYMIEREL